MRLRKPFLALSILIIGHLFSQTASARFLSEDPLGFQAGDVNFYTYVGNNPVNFNDPSGNIGEGLVAKAISKLAATTGRIGGRLGNAETRVFNAQQAQKFVDEGFVLEAGGGVFPERLLKEAVNGQFLRAFPDAQLRRGGETLFFNTVDTLADGVTPTLRELTNANKIRTLVPNAQLVLIPKPTPGTVFAGGALVGATGVAQASGGGGGGSFFDSVGRFFREDAVPLALDFLVSPGTAQAPTLNAGAGGGFVLYPSKPNTNTLRSVYSK